MIFTRAQQPAFEQLRAAIKQAIADRLDVERHSTALVAMDLTSGQPRVAGHSLRLTMLAVSARRVGRRVLWGRPVVAAAGGFDLVEVFLGPVDEGGEDGD